VTQPAGAAMGNDADRIPEPVTPELLADLQAGLLDDATAAGLRQRVRTDPEAAATLAALDQVRRDLADLGADESSAPDVPAEVTARVGAALRERQHAPAHSIRHTPRWQLFALVAGIGAAVVGAVVGGLMLTRGTAPTWSTGPTAKTITASRQATQLPLSNPQIVDLLSQRPDYGPLTDPQQRASCLSGLGYSAATAVLGARPVDMNGRPAVLFVLPANTPRMVLALVVEPDCSSGRSGLLANTLVSRP
jgi:anti-sigma factor RsiW